MNRARTWAALSGQPGMDWWAAALRAGQNWQQGAMAYQSMWIAAAEVIWRRSLEMSIGTMTLPEATRMIMEKPSALARSAELGAISAAKGMSPGKITSALVGPISSRARSNARRLRRRKL